MAKKSTQLRFSDTHHPVVLEVNTRVLLHELSAAAGTAVALGNLPEELLDEWSAQGIDGVWLMGVWATGDVGRKLAVEYPGMMEAYRRALPDATPEDVLGSPYAVQEYRVAAEFGGGIGLRSLRLRLARRGIGLILDYVSNHTARDHKWVKQHPEYYIHRDPSVDPTPLQGAFSVETSKGMRWVAHGRDPMFPEWEDTAQLNPKSATARAAMIAQLGKIAGMCDGVRCDMAMLLLTDVFNRTWGDKAHPEPDDAAAGEFWEEAIETIQKEKPEFIFIAEAYWDRQWDLQQLGFHYTYDKTLYDRLLREGAMAVRDHLKAEMAYQQRSLRFLENHDEERAARVLPSEPWQFAAATVIGTVPGMLLLHEGQMDGRTVRVPVQLRRRVEEAPNMRVRAFYQELLNVINHPIFKRGEWSLLSMRAAWHDNHTWQNFLSYWWREPLHGQRLVVINYAPHSGQCYVDLPLDLLEAHHLEFRDLMGSSLYVRERSALQAKGMYFDLPGYGLHIFEVAEAHK